MLDFLKPNGRVNMTVKNHLLRYVYSKSHDMSQIERFGDIPLPVHIMEDGKIKDFKAFTRLVEEVVDFNELKNKPLYFNVPDYSVVIRPFEVPVTLKEDEIKGYLYMKLGDTLHLPFDDPAFDYSVVSRNSETVKLVLFCYPEEQIRLFEQAFRESKLNPKAADINSLSIYRLYVELGYVSSDEHLLLIDWNLDGCVLTVFHEGQPVFINHTKSTLPLELWKNHHGRFEWTGDEQDPSDFTRDQVNEIERIMDFYRFSVMNGQAGVTKVMLVGDWPENELAQELLQGDSIQVDTFDPSVLSFEDLSIPVHYVDAVGLSLKQ